MSETCNIIHASYMHIEDENKMYVSFIWLCLNEFLALEALRIWISASIAGIFLDCVLRFAYMRRIINGEIRQKYSNKHATFH